MQLQRLLNSAATPPIFETGREAMAYLRDG